MDASRDLKMMQTPGDWPRWPILPLIKRQKEGWPIDGLLLAEDRPRVYLVNMYLLGDRPGRTYGEKMQGLKTEDYETFEDLAREWRVD